MAHIQHARLFFLILYPLQALLINSSTPSVRYRHSLTVLPQTELQIAAANLMGFVKPLPEERLRCIIHLFFSPFKPKFPIIQTEGGPYPGTSIVATQSKLHHGKVCQKPSTSLIMQKTQTFIQRSTGNNSMGPKLKVEHEGHCLINAVE